MAVIGEARFDLVASDRTRGAFSSVERNLGQLRRAASMIGGALGLAAVLTAVRDTMALADKGISLIGADQLERLRETQSVMTGIKVQMQSIAAIAGAKMQSYAIGMYKDAYAMAGGVGGLLGTILGGGSMKDAQAAYAQSYRGEISTVDDFLAQSKAMGEYIAQAEQRAAAERELASAESARLSSEASAQEKIQRILLERMPIEQQLEELKRQQLEALHMEGKDEGNRARWLLRQLELEQEIAKIEAQAAPADQSTAGSGAREGVQVMGFADVVRQAQDYASRRTAEKQDKANALLAKIEENTAAGSAVFG